MAVHHFTAVGIESARGWQPMDTFPRDGAVVEVQDIHGRVVTATWRFGEIFLSEKLVGAPTHWRNPE
jgi:hypothetical protein